LTNLSSRITFAGALLLTAIGAQAQDFELRRVSDSLYWLNDWRLPYPIYRFETGDVDGDGSADAMVGVIKATRFYPEQARRLFIFKQVNGEKKSGGKSNKAAAKPKVRPLWLGSKLGGVLLDFRFANGCIRALETTTDGRYVVADYRWDSFGMTLDRFLVKGVNREAAVACFEKD